MVDPKVVKVMTPYFSEAYGNASSVHDVGTKARIALNDSRRFLAKAIGANEKEIYFTSGGTESNNLALKGAAFAQLRAKTGKKYIVTTKVEHSCVLSSCEWLEGQGFKVTYLDVDQDGFVRVEDLEKALSDDTFLVSIIHGHNEIGTVQDLNALGAVCKKAGVLFHTDACQSFTKVPIDVRKAGVDMMTLNSHKIHGPKGVGALYVRKGVELVPWQHGGGHEGGLRAGTENVAGIVGFAEAAKLAIKGKHVKEMVKMRDLFVRGVLGRIEGVKLNGPLDEGAADKRLCNNANFSFPVDGEMLGDYLNSAWVSTSKGSACSANEGEKPSHVLKAIGRSDKDAKNAIRFSLSRFTSKKDLEKVIDVLVKSVGKV